MERRDVFHIPNTIRIECSRPSLVGKVSVTRYAKVLDFPAKTPSLTSNVVQPLDSGVTRQYSAVASMHFISTTIPLYGARNVWCYKVACCGAQLNRNQFNFAGKKL